MDLHVQIRWWQRFSRSPRVICREKNKPETSRTLKTSFETETEWVGSFCHDVVQGKLRAMAFAKKKNPKIQKKKKVVFFFLLRIVMVLDYFTGGV